MKTDEELLRIFNKRDLWVSSSVISGTLVLVIAILLPIMGTNELLPSAVIFAGIAACCVLMLFSLTRWHNWNKRAHEGIGARDWMRSSF